MCELYVCSLDLIHSQLGVFEFDMKQVCIVIFGRKLGVEGFILVHYEKYLGFELSDFFG